MGFEDNDENKGFEADTLDLDTADDLSMGTGKTKAQRKKGIKTEAAPRFKKRDSFGRRSDGEESGEGADMLNPDKPMKLSGGMNKRENPMPSKPLNTDSSKFSYLFDGSEDEEDDDAPLLSGKAKSIDALSINGDEDNADEVFSRGPRNITEPGKRGSFNRGGRSSSAEKAPVRETAPDPEPSPMDDISESPMTMEPRKRFSKREDSSKKSRFTKRESSEPTIPAPLSSGKSEVDAEEAVKALEAERTAMKVEGEKAAREAAEPEKSEPHTEEQSSEPTSTYDQSYPDQVYYGQPQSYGYSSPAPMGYQQYPYAQNPYMSPYGGYPYPQYSYPQYPQYPPYPQYPQYPPYSQQYAPYSQPQIIPAGYVYQAGFIPIESAAGQKTEKTVEEKSFKRRKSPSGSRSAYRYDRDPDAEPVKVKPKTQIKKNEPEPVVEIEPVPPRKPNEPMPSIKELQEAQTSQLERILAQIPPEAEPVREPAPEPAPAPRPEPPKSSTPSRFNKNGSEEPKNETPSRFNSRNDEPKSEPESKPKKDEFVSTSKFRNRRPPEHEGPIGFKNEGPANTRFSRRSSLESSAAAEVGQHHHHHSSSHSSSSDGFEQPSSNSSFAANTDDWDDTDDVLAALNAGSGRFKKRG